MNAAIPDIQSYLREVLGHTPARPRAWLSEGLPYFIQDSLDLVELPFFGQDILLAIDKQPGSLTPAEISNRIAKLRALAGPVLYAASTVSYDDRRQLIGHKVPFVVPGNQLYLPDLGIDLREHFRRRAHETATSRLSPSTQALLIRHLLERLRGGDDAPETWQVSATVRELGYTVMTGSRAVNELVDLGLGEVERRGRSVHLRFKSEEASALWLAAQPFLRSPILRSRWLPEMPDDLRPHLRLAGASALARHTLLGEPAHATYAVQRDLWLTGDGRRTMSRPEPGAIEVQVWSYSPALIADTDEVDPLSLIASLRDETDERMRIAGQEFEEALGW